MELHTSLNNVLVGLFRDIINQEEISLISPEFSDITVNDMHIIEAIGMQEPRNMTKVANSLHVTVGTLTIGMNNLVKKGYVTRVRSEQDRRVILLTLTEKGQKAYRHHEEYHIKMTEEVMKQFSEEEMGILLQALERIRTYFAMGNTDND